MPGTVRIIVGKGGRITVQANGIQGPSCQPLVDQLSAKITGVLLEAEHTEEFYAQASDTAQTQAQ